MSIIQNTKIKLISLIRQILLLERMSNTICMFYIYITYRNYTKILKYKCNYQTKNTREIFFFFFFENFEN